MAVPKILKVLTWNINSGHGARGNFRQKIEKTPLIETLDRIAFVIRAVDPDVVCLQEVDFRWSGTHLVNQRRHLRKAADFSYAVSTAHQKRVVSKPLIRLMGKSFHDFVDRYFGTVVLSKYPIVEKTGYNFGDDITKIRIFNEFMRLLNESKGYTNAEIEVEGRRVSVVSVHLLNDVFYEIFKHLHGVFDFIPGQVRGQTFIREWQVQRLLRDVALFERPAIVAGDFNMIPSESRRHNFEGSRNGDPDDYTRDRSMRMVRESGLVTTVPELFGRGTPEQIEAYRTYPSLEPDRVLDYVFVTRQFEIVDYRVVTGEGILRRAGDAMPSDHLPVLATVRLLS